jgi:hypothetical protein
MTVHRDVVEDERFVRELAAIDPDVHRTDAALEYVKELLARDPDAGLKTRVPGIMVAPIVLPYGGRAGWQAISIFYAVTPTAIHLLSVIRG